MDVDARHGITLVECQVRDAATGEPAKLTLVIAPNGVAFRFPGYGDKFAGSLGEPVFVEIIDGVPTVQVWADIAKDEPTHSVSLDRARCATPGYQA